MSKNQLIGKVLLSVTEVQNQGQSPSYFFLLTERELYQDRHTLHLKTYN